MVQAVVLPAKQTGPRLRALPPLAIYVHVPWCVRKCPYCDFNSHELRRPARGAVSDAGGPTGLEHAGLDPVLERSYLDALILDLDQALPAVWGRTVHAIFIGGGTPSLLSARAVDELLCAIRTRVRLDPGAEITLEANPGTFETRKFADFRAAGVNRLSIGIQSFDPAHLRSLGRIHDDRQARAAIEIARAHFDNFNLDLMYALPQQSVAQALADLERALAYAPPHLSVYHLTIEPNTAFHRHPPNLPEDDVAADMQEAIEERLDRLGYRHYETSAFAQAGRASRHNLNYWTFGDYIGIGAGAHGKISFADRIVREMRWKNPRQYLQMATSGTPVQSSQEVGTDALPFEFMMNALRLVGGFELRLFEERTGLPLASVLGPLDRAVQRGLIERDFLRARPTLRGQRFLNDLLQLFL
ncbi:MAG TPA: radical SAM family heme chaperone HemW [Burkholderiales bacterium]|nr:radical SAM family heme chaperone HemW [Burkholderiales bacterium]